MPNNESPPQRKMRTPRLSTKIYLVVGLLLGFFVLSVFNSSVGFRFAFSNYEQSTAAGRFAVQISTIDRDILATQQYVQDFAHTGRPHTSERVFTLSESLDKRIEAAAAESDDEEVQYHLSKMRSHLTNYRENFTTVVDERQIRTQLVNNQILRNARRINTLFDDVINAADSEIASFKATVQSAFGSVSLAVISALQYLNNPDALQVETALQHLRRAKEILASLEPREDQPLDADLQELAQMLDDFEKGFLRTVQATRGYLALVNVVMAGESAEFSYHSRRVKELSEQQLATISQDASQQAKTTRNRMLQLSVLAVVVGLTLSLGLVRSIVKPIGEITSTFVALGRGEEVQNVPGLSREDEIGEMALAADVFKDKNRQTNELLAKSQKITRELDAKAAQLQKSNQALDSFAYVASHDLKSPLRAIDNLSSWIAEDVGDSLPEASRLHLETLRQRVKRMNSLLDDLLEYSRAGRVRTEATSIDVNDLVLNVQDTIDWPADMKLELADNLPTIITEHNPLMRVFFNLMTNAVKYRTNGDSWVKFSSRDLGEFVEFSIRDNGQGIAPKYHAHIFEMFKRLHSQDEVEGSGMGLSLVKKLVESYGGTIHVESQAGDGATFAFTWPKNANSAQFRSEPAATIPA